MLKRKCWLRAVAVAAAAIGYCSIATVGSAQPAAEDLDARSIGGHGPPGKGQFDGMTRGPIKCDEPPPPRRRSGPPGKYPPGSTWASPCRSPTTTTEGSRSGRRPGPPGKFPYGPR